MDNIPSPSAFTPSQFSNVDWEALELHENGGLPDVITTQLSSSADTHHSWQKQQQHELPQQYHYQPELSYRIVEVQDEIPEVEAELLSHSRVTLPDRPRQSGPSLEEWNRIRPVFTRLYRDQKMKLNTVMELLSTYHNFDAAPHMYKKRVADWELCKNMKRSEKESVLVTMSEEGILQESQRLSLRIDKIQRYKKEKYKRDRVSGKSSLRSISCLTGISTQGEKVFGDSRFGQRRSKALIHYMRPPQETQEFMWLKKEFHRLLGGLPSISEAMPNTGDLLSDALDLLELKAFGHLTVLLSRFAIEFRANIERPSLNLLYDCVRYMTLPSWYRYEDYRVQLISYMYRASYNLHTHLAKVIHVCFKNSDPSRTASILELLNDTFSNVNTEFYVFARAEIEEDKLMKLIHDGELEPAAALCKQLLQSPRSTGALQRNWFFYLGQIHYFKGELKQALEIIQEIDGLECFRDIWVDCLMYEAFIFSKKGDDTMTERRTFQTMEAVIDYHGTTDIWTVRTLIFLVDAISANGCGPCVHVLKENFGETWQQAVSIQEDAGKPNWPDIQTRRLTQSETTS